MTEQLIKIFVVLFVVVEPLSLVPMFGALTRGGSERYRRKMALKSTFLAAIILLVFAFTGNWFLGVMGISLDAFKIAGGLLLFMISLDMVFARPSGVRTTTVREQEEARYKEDISVFPLAFPLISGPGAMATLLLLVGEVQQDPLLFAGLIIILLLVLALSLLFMLLTPLVMRVLGVTGANVISRLLGVVLVALSVQYVVDGIRGSFGL